VEYRRLGGSGAVVSALALGTMTFGAETDEDGAQAQLDRFVEVGGTLIDTADVYSKGASEEIVGRWLAQRPADVRDRVVVATKGRFALSAEPNGVGLSRRHLTRAIDASLRRLGVDCIDLYQVHAYDPLTPIEETLRCLDDQARAGKIHYVGLSNFTGWQLQRAVDVAEFCHLSPPVTLQPQYSLLVREIEWELVPACLAAGIGLLPWSPLAGGWLTGKYGPDERPTGATRAGENPRGLFSYDARGLDQRTWQVVDAVRKVAEDGGASMAQVALAWLLGRPAVCAVILGARTLAQLEDNLAAAEIRLEPGEMARLDEVSAVPVGDYPYGRRGVAQRRRNVEG
jgi:aryl-alcohol dehydrogenase-like predicted oxidoreductase